jgi:uncharacterized protein (TIGR03435 family)
MNKLLGMTCLAGLLSCGIAFGQSTAVPMGAVATKSAVDAKPITFEVASIRRNKTGVGGGNGATADGYDVRNAFPIILLANAYDVPDFSRMQGLPEWCRFGNEGYDIRAKVADSDVAEWQKLSQKNYRGALQALLQDRFQLKAHFETRDVPAYALVVAKKGPKFKAATPGDTYPNGEHDRQGKPQIGFGNKSVPGSDHSLLIAQAVPMAAFAQYLGGFSGLTAGWPVVDKTGLTGLYDFSMPFMAHWGPNREPDPSEPSIFTVLQDSLGLQLRTAKVPVQFLVIDHIERPTEN